MGRIHTGLLLRAKFQSGQTQKTQFSRCFDLNPLQIRGVKFFELLNYGLKSWVWAQVFANIEVFSVIKVEKKAF